MRTVAFMGMSVLALAAAAPAAAVPVDFKQKAEAI